MQDDEAKTRKTLNFYILFQISPALGVFPSGEPPLLGEDFAFSAGKLFDALSEFRSRAVTYLCAIPLDQLQLGFTDRGKPRTPEHQNWCAEQQIEFGRRFRSLSTWQLALFDADRTFAKYDYWAKAAFFSLDEILWLSVGLEPLPEFNRALIAVSRSAHQRDPVVNHMMAQRELLRRSLDPNGHERRLTAKSVLDWANFVQHELHPGFRRTLEKMVQRDAAQDLAAPSVEAPSDREPTPILDERGAAAEDPPKTKQIDPRERLGMAKLLVAIAIEQFGYDPGSKRSPIPTELEDVAARLGLELSHDTILKYLRLGAQHLPKNWKPHQ